MLTGKVLILGLACIAGGALGATFFGGLWWTVRRGMASRRPARWFLVSLLLRTGIVLAGIYLVAGGRWDRMVACLLGFAVARLVVVRLTAIPDHVRGRHDKGIPCT